MTAAPSLIGNDTPVNAFGSSKPHTSETYSFAVAEVRFTLSPTIQSIFTRAYLCCAIAICILDSRIGAEAESEPFVFLLTIKRPVNLYGPSHA